MTFLRMPPPQALFLLRAKREIGRIWGELRSLEMSATGDAWERAQNASGPQERGLQRLVGDEEVSETLYIRPLTRSFFQLISLVFCCEVP